MIRRPAMQEVEDWLQKLGVGQYAASFAQHDIDFSILLILLTKTLPALALFVTLSRARGADDGGRRPAARRELGGGARQHPRFNNCGEARVNLLAHGHARARGRRR
jgi:hypothetical protein